MVYLGSSGGNSACATIRRPAAISTMGEETGVVVG